MQIQDLTAELVQTQSPEPCNALYMILKPEPEASQHFCVLYCVTA